MQRYIAIQRQPTRPRLLLGLFDEPMKEWQRKARALRVRREGVLRLYSRGRKRL